MIIDQITTSLDAIKSIEKQLKEDIMNAVFTSRKNNKETPQFKKASAIIRHRRRSVGNYTYSKMINLSQNDSGMAIINSLAQLNESDNVSQLPHSQQISGLPSLKNMKASKDETMITEMEYVNMMKDSNFRASVLQGDHSFFRSIVKVEQGETQLTNEDKSTENAALMEVNEQHIKKI